MVNANTSPIVVITVDGPSGSGKGTLSRLLARSLNFNFLDSGVLYRLLGLAAKNRGINLDTPELSALVELAQNLNIAFECHPLTHVSHIILDNQDVTDIIRTEECGEAASKVALIPSVRAALLQRQRAFLTIPGLVADGRDMGTVVFPDAQLKIFLEASVLERAKRRHNELQSQDLNVSLEAVLKILEQRDERDKNRSISPLVPAADAIIVDTTKMSIQQVLDHALSIIKAKGLRP